MKFTIDDADFQNYWKTLYWPKEILKVTEDCQQRLETGRQEFIDELIKDREKLAENIEEISASVEEFVSSGDIDQVCFAVKGLKAFSICTYVYMYTSCVTRFLFLEFLGISWHSI